MSKVEFSTKNDWFNKERGEKAISMLKFLVHNCYVEIGGKIFRQSEGIPMGTDPGPQIANGYLFGLERQWLLQKYTERRFDVLSRFKIVSRFIDDLKAFNSRGAIGEFKAEIYGPLQLTRSAGEDGSGAHFLDMDLLISGGMVHVGVYDKRDAFGFRVVSFPTLPSNVDEKQAHACLIGQLVRFGEICSKVEFFTERAQKLTSQLIEQGFDITLMKKMCETAFSRHGEIFLKYRMDKKTLTRICFKQE
jgi:hypothetical protein